MLNLTQRLTFACVALAISSLAVAENYEGRGATREAAREDLAQQILTTVSSKYKSEIKNEEGAFTKSLSQSSSQSSNVILHGVLISQTAEGEFIAHLNKKQFQQDAQLTLNKVYSACKTELPEAWQPRRKVLDQCVQDVDAAVSMARVVGKEKDINRLSNLRTEIYNEYNKALVVIASTPEVGYSLDGATYDFGTSHRINSGEHTIIWQGDGYCKLQQTFTIKAGEEKGFNPKLNKSPELTFVSPNLDAELSVNGKPAKLGEVQKFSECEGQIVSYSLSNDYDAKNDSLKLKPNLKRKIDVRLLTKEEAARKKQREADAEQRLKERQKRTSEYTKSFVNLNAWQLIYGYGIASDYENTHRFRLENVKNFSALRYGWGVMYGRAANSSEYEVYGQAALQLPEIGGHPLGIFGWSFVPYAGAELGLGYHKRYHEKAKLKVHEYKDKFSHDKLIVRYLGGIDLPLSQNLAVKFQASKQATMEKSLELNFGISLLY